MVRVLFALALGCAACGSNPPTCASVCSRLKAAGCSDPFVTCEAGCQNEVGGAPERCRHQVDAYLSCAATAAIVCQANGRPAAPSCDASRSALQACRADTGGDGGSDGCLPDPSADLAQTYCGALPTTPRLRECPSGSPDPACVSAPGGGSSLYCCPRSAT